MDSVRVTGKNRRHKVFMYTISTCAWCKMAKQFLKESGVEYEYVDVDLCNEEDRETIRRDILRRGSRPSYPIVIIDDKTLINGFHEDKIKKVLEV